MIGWLQLTDEQRITSLQQASIVSGITAKAIEKDWWVTLTLKALFNSTYAEYFIFKGGTSLSKGWKLIDRFSEDIDIALDPRAFNREYLKDPSHNYIKTLKKEGCSFTSSVLLESLKTEFVLLNVPADYIEIDAEEVSPTIPDKDPQTLYVRYKSLFAPHEYIADVVKIEFSVRSLKEPFALIKIQSILSEFFPNNAYAETPFDVVAVEPRKTLLEKAFLLHEKFLHTEAGKIKVERLSRHLYDLVKMMDTPSAGIALKDPDFYATLVEHRRNYIRLSNVDYNTLHQSTLSFIPPDELIQMFREDYSAMQLAMIYGDSPDFDVLISQLKLLQGRFRMIGEYKSLDEILLEAEKKLVVGEVENSIFKTSVSFHSDPYLPPGPANKSVIYEVEFIYKKRQWWFENIVVQG